MIDFVSILRRRWWAILVVVAIGVVAAAVTKPERTTARRYRATATVAVLRTSATPVSDPINASVAAAIATLGEVPTRAAARLNFGGEPQRLASQVTTEVDDKIQVVDITAVNANGPRAALVANTFAQELVDTLEARREKQVELALQAANDDANKFEAQVAELDRRIATVPPPADIDRLLNDRNTATRNLGSALGRVTQLSGLQGPGSARLSILREAVPVIAPKEAVNPPDVLWVRVTIAALLSLMVGAGLAILLDRLDPRVRSKRQAEEAFGLPVVAQVPPARVPSRHKYRIASVADPHSAVAEGYRHIRTAVTLMPLAFDDADGELSPTSPDAPAPSHAATGERKVVVVTSPGPSEGKSTLVANLAAAFAEAGKSVLVLSTDSRRPAIHQFFDIPEGRGLSDAADKGMGAAELKQLAQKTKLGRVWLIRSGAAGVSAGGLFIRHPTLLQECRGLADVVLVDTPPLLVANDARDLLPGADAVVLVARSGLTTVAAAEQATEVLYRLKAPVIGVALIGAADTPHAYAKYYRRYRGADRGSGLSSNGQDGTRKSQASSGSKRGRK